MNKWVNIAFLFIIFQRFYEHGGETQVAQDAQLKPSMDIFAVGLALSALF